MSMVPDIRPGAPLSLRGMSTAGLPGPIELDLTGYGCLLGPAGSGKHALLRAIAGRTPYRGQIALGHVLDGIPPARRRIAVLTRHGSLPHRPLAVSLARAMTARGIPSGLHATRIAALLDEFALSPNCIPASLPPDALLRARLAEALAAEPALLLIEDVLDLADDAESLITTLRAAQSARQMTVLHALRRRSDAFALADHLAILQAGCILQQGPPLRLYERPATIAVALATGPATILTGTLLDEEDDIARVRLTCGPVVEADPARGAIPPGAGCRLLLRPERIAISAVEASVLGENAIPGVLQDLVHAGDTVRLAVAIGTDIRVAVHRPAALGSAGLRPGMAVSIAWQSRHATLFPATA